MTASEVRDIAINGRFLTQRLSGVQRYAREITRALDDQILADPQGLGQRRWRLIVPHETTSDYALRAIETVSFGRCSGHLWEQWDLLRAARGQRLINLGNSGPVLHRDSITVIHDAAVFQTPQNFGARYGMAHRALGRLLARTSRIGTVSDFSREELSAVLGLTRDRIFVAGNGCDHLAGRAADETVLAKLDLTPGRYFLFVGSPTPNKNLDVAIDAFSRLGRPGVRFVIAGSLNHAVFGGSAPDKLPGVIMASGCSDEAISALYAHAAALVFPSRYEGFGIPPLEAMAHGCPVLASDIPVLRETCGDAARFFDPDDAEALASLMAAQLDAPRQFNIAGSERTAMFTWANGARSLAEAIVAADRSG
ncbi:MAG: glycosyltransferase family 4 protein [Sphingomonadaceae bacterium]